VSFGKVTCTVERAGRVLLGVKYETYTGFMFAKFYKTD